MGAQCGIDLINPRSILEWDWGRSHADLCLAWVLLRSHRPSGDRSGTASVRVETGIDSRFAASVEIPLAGGLVNARLSAQSRDDRGWFANDAPGAGVMGADRTRQARGVLMLAPSEAFEVTLIHERGDTDSDGPATQNRRRFGGFDFAIDEPGYSRVDWAHVIVGANRLVRFGNGRITNVFGWREVEHDPLADIDSTADPIFQLFAYTDQSQLSNELRYSGWMGDRWEVTAGIYWFIQDIRYRERRILRGTLGQSFLGDQDHGTGGLFLQHDFDLGRDWVLSLGARYTLEKKDVQVATAGGLIEMSDRNWLPCRGKVTMTIGSCGRVKQPSGRQGAPKPEGLEKFA